MSELATRNDAFAAPQGLAGAFAAPTRVARPNQLAANDHFERMGKWLELFIATEQVANVLARTAFVPEPMRGQPENIAAAMMKSLELGIDPLDGLSCIHVVKGKIGFSAEFMRRRIIEAGHEIVIDESTDSRCKIRGRRAGSAEWQTVTFTEDQARKAKINLGDYPADKLVARASSRLCRRVFPDVLAGTTIVDDIDDGADVIDSEGAAVQRKRKPRKAAPVKAERPQSGGDVDDLLDEDEPAEPASEPVEKVDTLQADEAQQDDLLDDEAPPLDAEGPATKPQNRKMHALFRDVGITDRADRLAVCSAILEFPLESSSGLTLREAGKLIDTLEEWQANGTTDDQVREILNAQTLASENSSAPTEQEK